MKSTKEYINLFSACSIDVGDTVRIVRNWRVGEYGYGASSSCKMDFSKHYTVVMRGTDSFVIEHASDKQSTLRVPFFAICIVQKKTPHVAIDKDYSAFHKASGLKIGDIVKVVRKAEGDEMGWLGSWRRDKNAFVGKTGKITRDADQCGWEIDFGLKSSVAYWFPTFVLEKIEPSVPEKPVVSVANTTPLTKKEIGKLYSATYRRNTRKRPKVHNPDNIVLSSDDVKAGYRLLFKAEVKERFGVYDEIERFDKGYWYGNYRGDFPANTYRTKLSRKELAKLK